MRGILLAAVVLAACALGCEQSSTASLEPTQPAPRLLLAAPSNGITVQVGTVYSHRHEDVAIHILRILDQDSGDQVVTTTRINGNQPFEATVPLEQLAAMLTNPPDSWDCELEPETVAY